MNNYKKLIIKNTMLICVIFSVLFSLSFYVERYFFSKKSYQEHSQQSIKSISNTFDNSFFKIQDLTVLFHENDSFAEYAESKAPSANLRKDIRTYLNSAIGSMPSTNFSVAIAQPYDMNIISSTSITSPEYFAKRYGFQPEEMATLLSTDTLPRPAHYVFFTQTDNKWYYTIVIRNDTYFDDGSYIVFCTYDMEEILSMLPKNTNLLISQAAEPLYCSGNYSKEQLSAMSRGENIRGYTTIASYSSPATILGNISYTLIIPKSLYFSHINKHLTFTLMALLLLFILSVLLSRKISATTYGPIEKLVNQISDMNFEPSENEIETISSVISLLNKRNDELNTMVKDSHIPLKEKFFNDFIHGHLSSDKASLGIDLYLPDIKSIPELSVIVLDADFEYDATYDSADDLHAYYGIIETLFQDEFKDCEFFHMTSITPSVYGIVVSYDDIDAFTGRLKNLILNIEIDLGISMQSTISKTTHSWDKLPQILLTTYYKHTSNKLSPTYKTVSSIDEHNFNVMYSPELENEIYTSCVRNNKEKLVSSLDLLLKENMSSNSDFNTKKSQLSVLFYALCIRIFTFTELDESEVFGHDYSIYNTMNHCNSPEEFCDTVRYIFITISDAIKNIQNADEHNYAKNMIDYIHQNYNVDISLHDLATHMNMSQAYVSRLFKKLTNSNFKDYLAKVRVEKAVSFLTQNPSSSIQEIAAMVGYNNAKPFTALFTKTMGVTPSEYRKLHRDK